ncbi:MAG: hypothetical protein V4456_20885 [Bacteroidota bacterium]
MKTPETKKFVSHAGLIDLIEKGSAEMLQNSIRNHLENHLQGCLINEQLHGVIVYCFNFK